MLEGGLTVCSTGLPHCQGTSACLTADAGTQHPSGYSMQGLAQEKAGESSEQKKKCYLVSSSNKAFTGEQKWFGPLTKRSLPKKIHAQAHMFQVAAGRSVAAHVSLQHFLFGSRLLVFLCLFIKLQIYRKVTLCNPRCFIALVNQLIVTRFKKKQPPKPASSCVRNAWHL